MGHPVVNNSTRKARSDPTSARSSPQHLAQSTGSLPQPLILAFYNKFCILSLQVQQIQGVHGVHATHFWTLCSNSYVGGLKFEVPHDADPKYVISHTKMIFRDIGVRELFLDYEWQQNNSLTPIS